MSRRARLVRVGAVLAVPLAIALFVLAADVLRMPGRLASGDVRFEAAPRQQRGLWQNIDVLPGDLGARLLGVRDDLSYRRTLALFVRVEPGKVEIYGPELENLYGRAQFELTRGSAADPNPKRRSQLLNLLATTYLTRPSLDSVEAQDSLRKAIQTLRSAVDLDPGNEDAKINLELALRNAQAMRVPGTDPTSGAAQGTLSGQGHAGSGY